MKRALKEISNIALITIIKLVPPLFAFAVSFIMGYLILKLAGAL